jgi:apolipoprotein D and lipocalin family protein
MKTLDNPSPGSWRSWPRAPRTLGALLLWLCTALPVLAEQPLATVEDFDLSRYLGTWHQIALLPNRFQARCVADTSAHYALRSDGRIEVVNRCREKDGDFAQAVGLARRNADYDNPAILEVRFAPAWLSALPFVWGDYWVIALGDDYRAALVGAPNRKYLWILAREPRLDDSEYARLVDIAKAQGFDVSALKKD